MRIEENPMTYFKRSCLVLAVCALIIPAAAKDKKPVESRPVAVPVVIDGNAAEWPADSLILEKDVNVSYAFQNDAANLYILFQFNEAKYMSSVEASGLTLWVNNDGKEKKNHGLHFYRKSVSGAGLIKILEGEGQTLTEETKKEYLSRPSYSIWACDVVNKKGEVVPHPGVPGGTFRMAKTPKTSVSGGNAPAARIQATPVYELFVPIALLADPNADKKWDPSMLLKIGFEWGGLTEDMRKNEAANLSDQRARASGSGTDLSSQIGGGEGSRDYGGGGDFDGAQMRALASKYKKLDFWLDLKVFQNK
jgi:hypothetical protein